MLVRMSENNLFVNEGFCNEDTQELVAQFYEAEIPCMGAKVVPVARGSNENCSTGDCGDSDHA